MPETRSLGDSRINPIGLGCMNVSHAYGPAAPEPEAALLIQHALDEGYDFLDMASFDLLGGNGKHP